jgi:mannose-6-phosphate isomerase-like protein (cupin superfamily)
MRPLAAAVLILGLVATPAMVSAQTPPPQPTPQPTPQPSKPRPAPTRPRASTPSALTIRVTDSFGAPLSGIQVAASGPVARSGVTDASGDLRFTGIRPGTYRLRFEGDKVITLEREGKVGAGQPSTIEVSLSAAPPPPPPPPAPKPEPAPASAGANVPPPEPRTVSIPDFVERNLLTSREPSKSTLVACAGTAVTNLLQIREPLKDQMHERADALLYVVGGEGLLVLGTQEVPLQAGTFSLVPRGSTYTLQRRGRSGLILLSTLTDTPCAAR